MDALEGVEESRVSWDGRFFLIELDPTADAGRVAEGALSALLPGAARLAPEDEAVQVASFRRGERWLNRAESVDLSRHEAGVLAAQFAAPLSAEIGLDPERAGQLESVLREELLRAFDRVHAAGGGLERLQTEWPDLRRRFESRVAEFLDAGERARVAEILDQHFAE
jgi:hypothetical protein